MTDSSPKQVVVIAGPTGSGKDSIARGLLVRSPRFSLMVTATTRAMRPGEVDGVNYHFFTKERFLDELAKGNILEHYHRAETDTYYGTYKPDLDVRLAEGKIVIAVIQIVGARYLKEHYGASTFFIVPESLESLERRVRARAPMSDAEWHEREEHTRREMEEDAPFYDHTVVNADGKLQEAIDAVVATIKKEGYQVE